MPIKLLLFLPLLIFITIFHSSNATQSVFSCPLTPGAGIAAGLPGTFPAYAANGLGEV
jgi:hypothetical protein